MDFDGKKARGMSVFLLGSSLTYDSTRGQVKNAESHRVKYWEIIADNLKKEGWSLGYVSAIDSVNGGLCARVIDLTRQG
jgi:hypothetical protein